MTRRIELSQNKYALVDDDDYDELNRYKWQAHKERQHYYALRMTPGSHSQRKQIKMHRQILGLVTGDRLMTDHINHNGLDNRRSNLRVVDHVTNLHNRKVSITNASGYTGVAWERSSGKWHAYIGVDRKRINLGRHTDIEDAIDARKQAEKEYWT